LFTEKLIFKNLVIILFFWQFQVEKSAKLCFAFNFRYIYSFTIENRFYKEKISETPIFSGNLSVGLNPVWMSSLDVCSTRTKDQPLLEIQVDSHFPSLRIFSYFFKYFERKMGIAVAIGNNINLKWPING